MTTPESTTSYVANVWREDHAEIFTECIKDPEASVTFVGGQAYFQPYFPLHDPDDPEDGPLYLMYCTDEGWGGSVYAPMCWAAEELERRVIRCLGMEVDIDDAVVAAPLPSELYPEVRFLATSVLFTAQHRHSPNVTWKTIASGDVDYSGVVTLGVAPDRREWAEALLEQYGIATRHAFGPPGGQDSEVFAEPAFLDYFRNALRALPQGWQTWVSPNRRNG